MKQLSINEIKEKAVPILKEAGIKRSSLFGSYVRGKQRDDSDIDLLVDFPKDKSLFDFVEVKVKLEDVFGKKVDLIEYDRIKPRLKEYILTNQLQIL
jgi:uncharacterized protein